MARHGFVYILANVAMPGRYKVGFTINSPHQRAEELGRATGVPMEFDVVGYAAFTDPQQHEARMHKRFAAVRCPGREFFQCPVGVLWDALLETEEHHSFADCGVAPWDYQDRPDFYNKAAV